MLLSGLWLANNLKDVAGNSSLIVGKEALQWDVESTEINYHIPAKTTLCPPATDSSTANAVPETLIKINNQIFLKPDWTSVITE